ncbi:hypothetical protein ACFWY6_05375 [Streptomyces sp. NPDC059037]|uniref:hypothetical protein n=1 Tax=Streptomyces sp. NPDC059037 TaxID=3346710 RepID=UPI0036C2F46B
MTDTADVAGSPVSGAVPRTRPRLLQSSSSNRIRTESQETHVKKAHTGMGTAVAALLIGAAAATASGAQSSPPTPDWVNAEGAVDEGSLPETMPLIGADGTVAKDANGKKLKARTRGRAPVALRSAPREPGKSVPLKRTRTGG